MTSTLLPTDRHRPLRLAPILAATKWKSRVFAMMAAATSAGAAMVTSASAPTRLALGMCGMVLVAAALVDVSVHRIPNRLMLGALVVVAAGVTLGGEANEYVGAVLGLMLAGGSMLAVQLGRGVGMGDVKMAAVVGAGTGAVAVVAAPLAIAVAAAMAAGFGLITRRQRLPLAPFLWAGWLVALVSARVAGLA